MANKHDNCATDMILEYMKTKEEERKQHEERGRLLRDRELLQEQREFKSELEEAKVKKLFVELEKFESRLKPLTRDNST